VSSNDARMQIRLPQDLKKFALDEAAEDQKAKGNASLLIRHMLEERRRKKLAAAVEGIEIHEF